MKIEGRGPALMVVLGSMLLMSSDAEAGKFKCSKASNQEVVDHLSDPNEGVRIDCIGEVSARFVIEGEGSLQRLAMEDSSGEVRVRAAEALEDLSSQLLVPVAEHLAVNDSEEGNRKKALRLLEKYGTETSAGVVAHVLESDAQPAIRRKAAIIIGKRGFISAEVTLMQHGLHDPDPQVMLESAVALVALGNATTRGYIHPILLEHPEESIRAKLVRAVEKAPLPQDRDVLVALLDDLDSKVARHAARALVKLGDRSVAPVLREKALQTQDRKVAEEFSEAAMKLEG